MKLKQHLRIICIILAAFIIPASISGCGRTTRRYSTDILGSFDTVITIIAYCDSDADFNRLEEYARSRFNHLHQLFDLYNPYPEVNNVHMINEQAGIAPVVVEPELLDLIRISRDWYHDSPQVTNIALGPVLKIWHDYRTRGMTDPDRARLPGSEELAAAALHTDIDLIELDTEASTVFLPDAEMSLDLGATAKGYATELITRELEAMGYQSFIISSGGNIRALGQPREQTRTMWGIGIQNPLPENGENAGQILDTAYVNNMSIVTSGDYQRYFVVDGKKYHHIIDPRTLFPGDYHLAVTVAVEDSGLADFLSTTLFLLPYEEGRAYIEGIPEAEALWVFKDGSVEVTDGMLAMLKERGGAVNPPPGS